MKRSMLAAVVAVVAVGVVVAGVWAAGSLKLYMNGEVASTDLRVINGRSYVPVADIAKALGAPITKREDGYEIGQPGGANQINGVAQGKIGDELFDGKWRFQVISVEDVGATYQERYYQHLREIKAQGKGDTLIVINCRLKNGVKKTQSPLVTERVPGNTALADEQGQSYPPLDYDARQQEGDKIMSYEGAALLPGAATDFALVFNCPKGTVPKALVYSLQAYPDDVGKEKHSDVRVNLGQ